MTSDAPELTEIATQLDTVAAATTRLLDAVSGLTDADLVEPSLLPGWTRGHVLAHAARNADSLVNLLLWARTGVETPQYASTFLREADIEAGALRPQRDQFEDLSAASERWLALARVMPTECWQATVRNRQGGEMPAARVLWMRLLEVEIHHVDLNIGYTQQDWPAAFVARLLPQAVADLSAKDGPGFSVTATDTGYTGTVGTPETEITGPAAVLAAWLIGRYPGDGLTGELPNLAAWK
ncbi:maleylpyruvate isomerase family mycothiol-dependent enzyme [Nocardia sp. SYP-A9097]|uniref:maleylpyruvate isomerase family mycothiol-dependent enzyme n=1 Tax=Nocardia sp. SYP-A9097 TaxID=2663237 RepID=UPI0013282167|nr:maleylpyruvate isomerase family mycothiol-dependent enzyme [Nocardia sp. SYP-A9097]MRH86080.1 maleylpyruvate isomerase family mycothiol-dependent enzyme [Nocardia sp. SYP-A9097]